MNIDIALALHRVKSTLALGKGGVFVEGDPSDPLEGWVTNVKPLDMSWPLAQQVGNTCIMRGVIIDDDLLRATMDGIFSFAPIVAKPLSPVPLDCCPFCGASDCDWDCQHTELEFEQNSDLEEAEAAQVLRDEGYSEFEINQKLLAGTLLEEARQLVDPYGEQDVPDEEDFITASSVY